MIEKKRKWEIIWGMSQIVISKPTGCLFFDYTVYELIFIHSNGFKFLVRLLHKKSLTFNTIKQQYLFNRLISLKACTNYRFSPYSERISDIQ